MTLIITREVFAGGIVRTWPRKTLIYILFAVEAPVTVCTKAGVVIYQVLTCAIVETWLILAVVNISITLFPSVSRLARAQEIADKVGTGGVVKTRVGITLIDF